MLSTNFPTLRCGAGPGVRSNTCNVCMMEIHRRDPTVAHQSCRNCFHLTCFETWHTTQWEMRLATTCPMCRDQLNWPRFPLQHGDLIMSHGLETIPDVDMNVVDEMTISEVAENVNRSSLSLSLQTSQRRATSLLRHEIYPDDQVGPLPQQTGGGSTRSRIGARVHAIPYGYSPSERAEYAYAGRESFRGGQDIPRSVASETSAGAADGVISRDFATSSPR